MRIPFWRRRNWWLTAAVSFVIAMAVAAIFVFPAAAAAICPQCFGFERTENSIYVERGMTEDARAEALATVKQARERVRRFYGELLRQTPVLICATDACYRRLRGGGTRGMAIYDFALMLSPHGVSETIAAHELSHIEFHARIGAWLVFRDAVPTWFDEGLAVVVSDDARYLDPPGLTDRCRGAIMELPATLREWQNDPRKDALYRGAACQVQGWVMARGGPAAALRLAKQIAGGTSFAEAYR